MNKELKFGNEARNAMREGIDLLANAVGSTLGPKGQLVVIGKYSNGKPYVTKDGVTVAKNISFSDEWKDAGAQLIKEAALKQLVVGDGTTTTTVIAQDLIKNIEDVLTERTKSPADIKDELDNQLKRVLANIEKSSIPVQSVEDLKKIATISANNDEEIGNLLADAFEKVSKNGVITVDESSNINTTIDVIQGMQFEQGYVSPYFCTDEAKGQTIFEDPYILITNEKINQTKDIINIVEEVYRTGKPLLMIAEEFDTEVINTLAVNITNGLKICCVKCPSFGDYRVPILEDIAICTNGKVATYENTIEPKDMTLEMLGRAKKVVINKTSTLIMNGYGNGSDIARRISFLQESLATLMKEPQHAQFIEELLNKRIAKLSGGIAVVHVGGTTELERGERKDRIEDAIAATKAAVEEGILPGGGIAYLNSVRALGIENTILGKSLLAPLHKLITSCGLNADETIKQLKPGYGFDAKKGVIVNNMINWGIIDPTKTVKMALLNAISVAELYLMTNCIIIPEKVI